VGQDVLRLQSTGQPYKCVNSNARIYGRQLTGALIEHLWTVHTVRHKNVITRTYRTKIRLGLIHVPPTCSAKSYVSDVRAAHLELLSF
jgi:hypothetical protein